MGAHDRDAPQTGHWSLRVSGNQVDRKVTDPLSSSLRDAIEAAASGLDKVSIDQTSGGWVAWANGYHEDPAAHKAIISAVNTVLAAGDYQPGSSEFTSPFVSVVNFHPVAEAQAATGQAANEKATAKAK